MQKGIMFFITCLAALNMTSVAAFADAKSGEKIFNSKKVGNCKTCHKLTAKKRVGPGLKGVLDTHTEDWIKKYLKDPQGTWEANDPETQAMKKRLGKENKKKTLMRLPKAGLTDEQIIDLIDFLKVATK